jgi:hypothetical protein
MDANPRRAYAHYTPERDLAKRLGRIDTESSNLIQNKINVYGIIIFVCSLYTGERSGEEIR